ncbi:hypothetical protein ACE1AT_22165 [Pelatocladus sp. BLCC-F211]|uniref:hypothetical protein n=1 Tax=Pelatocladus sp. BLCC-F211 TaxID=3342752 RepID=UPI0035BAE790
MTNLVPALVISLFAFATGFFVLLSYIEKPIWPLMFKTASPKVGDEDARLIHAELKRVIKIAPPTMKTVLGSGTIFTLIQTWQRDFDWASLTVLAFLIPCMSYIFSNVNSRIQAVDEVPSNGDIEDVRRGLGRLAAIHHIGLATAGGLTLLQLVIGIVLYR